MKLLLTFYNPSGGMETLNRIRGKALMEAGHEVHLLYTHDGNGFSNIRDIPTFVLKDPEAVKALVLREQYDAVVVCTDIFTLERIRQSGYRGRLIYEVQGLGTLETATSTITAFTALIRQHADGLLYPQTAHLQHLMRSRFPEIPQFCFDDPLDTENFGYSDYPPPPYPVMGWVGRIEANKNWREFIAIGERLMDFKPDLRMWMFGDAALFEAPEQEAFQHWLATSPRASRVIRHSNIPHSQMADYMSLIGDSGGFLCSTSILEGFGYAVAEAMLCRCPVLSTDSDGIRRFLVHDVTGKLYSRGDVEGAVQQALKLMDDRSLREGIRSRATRHIRSQFSRTVYVSNFQIMLHGMMGVTPKG
ncbi:MULTISPECIES: glycosyltransferase family 4 protein [Paenibacillus]|uniref:glycosyltransferase family 4 protein n=1 Tax=Paenibacillus TaxID=44249 RepID=UPI0003900C03|nr:MULTISPECIES: glycosyltransferase family 4 protein [Paenibacillus]CDN44246.1 Glycosyltransferase [Paenibacillus sp. P22]